MSGADIIRAAILEKYQIDATVTKGWEDMSDDWPVYGWWAVIASGGRTCYYLGRSVPKALKAIRREWTMLQGPGRAS